MFDFMQSASDDQIALLGCAGVLLGSGFMMYISYFLGPMARQDRLRQMDLLIRQRQQLMEPRPGDITREKAA
jgi:hypothetical protein